MKYKIKIQDIANFFYIIFLICLISKNFISYIFVDSYSMYNTIILLFGFICVFMKIILSKYTKQELKKCLIITLIGVFLFFICRNNFILYLILLIVGSKKFSFRTTAKVYVITYIVYMIIICVLYYLGVLENVVTIKSSGSLAFSLGYPNPNTLFLNSFILVELLYYLYDFKSVFSYSLSIGFMYLIYTVSGCRTGFFCFLILIVLSLIAKTNIFGKRIFKYLLFIFLTLLPTVIVLMCLMYDDSNTFFKIVNGFMSQRLSLANLYFKTFDISLFGAVIDGFDRHLPLDILYMDLLIQSGGIVFFVIWITVSNSLIYLALKNNRRREVILLTVLIFYSITEKSMLQAGTNFCIIFSSIFLFKQNIFFFLKNGGEKIQNFVSSNESVNY